MNSIAPLLGAVWFVWTIGLALVFSILASRLSLASSKIFPKRSRKPFFTLHVIRGHVRQMAVARSDRKAALEAPG